MFCDTIKIELKYCLFEEKIMNEIYIGDNLKVMQDKSFDKYKGKIKMIYIDPPYNTSSKFTFNDKRAEEEWIKFMKVRLECAKELLTVDGAIFISIDDNEYAELKVLCDKIFDKSNFVGTFITNQAKRSNAKFINTCHEYILCYAKDKDSLNNFSIKRIDIPEQKEMIKKICSAVKFEFKKNGKNAAEKKLSSLIKKYCDALNISWLKNYNCVDDNGEVFFAKDLSTPSAPRSVNIPEIGLKLKPLPTRGWSSDEKFKELYKKNMLCFKGARPYEKHFLVDAVDNAPSVINFYSRQGTNDLNKLGLRNIFDTPKPVELIKFLIRLVATNDGDTVLDFFAGSGTTAQAVYEVNKENKKNLNYVLIQLDEELDKTNKANKVCEEFGIEKKISDILLFRINTFLDKEGMKKDYKTFKI